MNPHPCANHIASCDHCYCCDVLGICCAGLTAGQRARLEASAQAPDRLRAALTEDAQHVVSLPELVRQEAQALPAAARLRLLAAPPAASLFPDSSRKEALHDVPAGPH